MGRERARERERERGEGQRLMRWKEDPGWNFNDGVDGAVERNPHTTRSQFSFVKAY